MGRVSSIIITGANGFLGSAILEQALLASDNDVEVLALVREQADLFRLEDLENYKLVKYSERLNETKLIQEAEVMIHTAWAGVSGKLRDDQVQLENLDLIRDSIDLASRLGSKHWIGIGSQAEYTRSNTKLSESSATRPTSLYGKTKLACYELAKSLCKDKGLKFSWLRVFDPYGPKDNEYWLIPYLIKTIKQKQELKLTACEQVWDFVYIDDVAKAILHIANNGHDGIFNVASGETIVLKELVKKVQLLLGSQQGVHYGALSYREDQVMHLEADMTKLRSTGWKAETSIDKGLENTIICF